MIQESVASPCTEHGAQRRWFSDEFFELILWHGEGGSVIAFQLCYARPKSEHALLWSQAEGYSHQRVLSGDTRPFKRAPVFAPAGLFPRDHVLAEFSKRSVALPPEIRSFVVARLEAYSAEPAA